MQYKIMFSPAFPDIFSSKQPAMRAGGKGHPRRCHRLRQPVSGPDHCIAAARSAVQRANSSKPHTLAWHNHQM